MGELKEENAMKKFWSLIVLAALLAALVGCAPTKTTGQIDETKPSMFVIVEQTGIWEIVYHRETMVMYAVSFGTYNCGTFVLLVNPDGSPMLWEP